MKKSSKIKVIIYVCIVLLIITGIVISTIIVSNKNKKKENASSRIDNEKNIVNIDDINVNKEEKKIFKKINVSLPIFMYHFILDDYGDNLDVENFLKPSTLEEQLKYIVDNGYETVFVNEIEDLSNYTKPVALTFDDCFVYFYNNAFPPASKKI